MFRIECDRCGAVFILPSELLAERAFSAHVCEGMRDLDELPFDLLRKLAYDEITEAQAWEDWDRRQANYKAALESYAETAP